MRTHAQDSIHLTVQEQRLDEFEVIKGPCIVVKLHAIVIDTFPVKGSCPSLIMGNGASAFAQAPSVRADAAARDVDYHRLQEVFPPEWQYGARAPAGNCRGDFADGGIIDEDLLGMCWFVPLGISVAVTCRMLTESPRHGIDEGAKLLALAGLATELELPIEDRHSFGYRLGGSPWWHGGLLCCDPSEV
jgi:hypothetical protein